MPSNNNGILYSFMVYDVLMLVKDAQDSIAPHNTFFIIFISQFEHAVEDVVPLRDSRCILLR